MESRSAHLLSSDRYLHRGEHKKPRARYDEVARPWLLGLRLQEGEGEGGLSLRPLRRGGSGYSRRGGGGCRGARWSR